MPSFDAGPFLADIGHSLRNTRRFHDKPNPSFVKGIADSPLTRPECPIALLNKSAIGVADQQTHPPTDFQSRHPSVRHTQWIKSKIALRNASNLVVRISSLKGRGNPRLAKVGTSPLTRKHTQWLGSPDYVVFSRDIRHFKPVSLIFNQWCQIIHPTADLPLPRSAPSHPTSPEGGLRCVRLGVVITPLPLGLFQRFQF